MREIIGGVVINEVEAKPLSELVINFLTAQRKESPFLDFKYKISIAKSSDFPEIAKDIFAFSNYGGGWILIGWKEITKSRYVPVGLSKEYEIDQAQLQERFNSFSNIELSLEYTEFERDFRHLFRDYPQKIRDKVNSISNRFAIIFVPPSHGIIKPIKIGKYQKGDRERVVFKKNDVFYRRGTQNIKPSKHEMELMKKRMEDENYRISFLSGEPDIINETIFSNLFKVTKLPRYVYFGDIRDIDDVSIKSYLREMSIFPEFFYKFKEWNNKIITFENIEDAENPYRGLVITSTIKKEPFNEWLNDEDKRRIVVGLLNRELKHFAIGKGLYLDYKNKLFFPLKQTVDKRRESWKSRYGASRRTVAAQMFAEQLGHSIYWHASFSPNFLQIGNNFYLRILPSFLITEDGRRAVHGFKEGTIITRLSYDKYNISYLNDILFWVHILGNGKNIVIGDYLEIESEPVKLQSDVGIMFDIPSSEFRLDIGTSDEEGINEDDEDV